MKPTKETITAKGLKIGIYTENWYLYRGFSKRIYFLNRYCKIQEQ